MILTVEEAQQLAFQLGQVFTPMAPIDRKALFAGRTHQLRQVIDAINRRGGHAIIYGERGVGKTSLANVLSEFLQSSAILAPHVNCDGTDNYSSLWHKVLSRIQFVKEQQGTGFLAPAKAQSSSATALLPEEATPDAVARALAHLGQDALLIVILDEFDRLRNGTSSRLFADTIKALSDYAVPATLVIVGVADNVEELITEHQSIERALLQVRMPRMSHDELDEIVRNALAQVAMAIDADALSYISGLSQGLPHYTHLLGLYSARQAVDRRERQVTMDDVERAIVRALDGIQQTLVSAYHKATTTPRKGNLYPQVLLACALARADHLGYFAPSDVRAPMSTIMGKVYDIPSFSRHLSDFCEATRGPILQRTGAPRRHRYRFVNPLMQPYVTMQGLSTGKVTRDALAPLRTTGDDARLPGI